MGLNTLLEQVKDAVFAHSNAQQHTGFDPSGLIGQIENLFGQHAANNPQVYSSAQDPYGDPADQGGGRFGNIRSAGQDPLGDPANQETGRFGNIRPASEDPLGDPADEEAGYRR